MRIVFMGTPSFAVPALRHLQESEHEVVAVYTKPPKPSGRGHKLIKSPVHQLAEGYGLQVHSPKSLKPVEEVAALQALKPDVVIVAAYGLILRKEVLELPKHGCINIHPSALPRWRGAAPIQRTIMAGDKSTDMCIMRMDEGLDTGDVILRQQYDIPANMTASELHDEMAELGGKLVLKVLAQIEQGGVSYTKQSEEGITYADKLTKEDEVIDWHRSAYEINCQIRALSPRPGAYFTYNNEIIKIITAEVLPNENGVGYSPGEVIDQELHIACKDGIIKPILLQRQGKKMIYTDAFLRGFEIPKGAKLAV
jgi:methionyl-tRNA formyltransferase